ncbi:hypothetical protein Hypma_008637 [Hypsizygus marmoreus]|uniref:Uncharacterized protein n=1 Tax=Hypsizygus marmoreus TaxID=39966 RepID=A0A369JU51_HYPMA|nr:hypothetical protein Hypma_008637 [Hypsizygus marmoreus]
MQQVKFHVEALIKAEVLVELLGLDPYTATVAAVDARDAAIKCRTCLDLQLGRHIMIWNQAVFHALSAKHGDIPPVWKLVDDEDELEQARAILANTYQEWKRSEGNNAFLCTHCFHFPGKGSVAANVRSAHGEDATMDDYLPYTGSTVPWPANKAHFLPVATVDMEEAEA